MRNLYLICGAPFSGKTTLAQILASKTQSHYISMDDIMRQRGFDLSQQQPVEEWAKAHQICLQSIDTLMIEGSPIVLDDTNYLKWLRDRFRTLALQHHYDITTIYLNIPLAELKRRRANVLHTTERNSLPDDAFYPIIEHFEIPEESEHPFIYDGTLNANEWIEKNIM
jgi:predicted kinase